MVGPFECKHQRFPRTRVGKAPRGDQDGERPDGGRPQWPSQSRGSGDKGRCEGSRAGAIYGGDEVDAPRRPFGAGCEDRALRGHREQSGGLKVRI